jgi:hypothetical protein
MKATANLKLAKEDPQGQGSAYTYARRYALAAVLGLAADEDDDGNEASKAPQTVYKPRSATKTADPRKGRIRDLLIALEAPCDTADQCRASVKSITKLDLIPENYDAIILALDKKREETDPLGKFMDESKDIRV